MKFPDKTEILTYTITILPRYCETKFGNITPIIIAVIAMEYKNPLLERFFIKEQKYPVNIKKNG